MFKKLFKSFVVFSLIIVGLFCYLIIFTNGKIFRQILTDKENQYKNEVEQTLSTGFTKSRDEILKIHSEFQSLVKEIEKNEDKIFKELNEIKGKSQEEKLKATLTAITGTSETLLTRFPNIQFIFLVNKTGNVEYGYPLTPPVYLYPIDLLKKFTGQGTIETYAVDMEKGGILTTFGIKIETTGKLNGKYLAANISFPEPVHELQRLNDILRKDVSSDDLLTAVFLMNAQGYIFHHNHSDFLLKNIREIWEGDTSFFNLHDTLHQNNDYFVKTRPIPDTDLVIGIMKKRKDIFFTEIESIRNALYFSLIGVTFVCIIVGILIALLSARRIVRPIEKLSHRAETASKGEYDSELKLKTGDELEQLSDVLNLFIRNTKENIENLENELRIAKRIQENLLPDRIPCFNDVEIEFELRSSKYVGGDYLDLIPLTDSKIAIVMADASGKSFYGAFHIAMVRALVHSQIKQFDNEKITPDEFLSELARSVHYNKIRYATNGVEMVTFLFGILDTQTNEYSFASAGHPASLLFRNNGQPFTSLSNAGLPLGVGGLKTRVYTTKRHAVSKNDLLLFFSDGLIEQTNSEGEMFGKDRIKELLAKHRDIPITDLKESIFQELSAFKGDEEQADDISIILLKI